MSTVQEIIPHGAEGFKLLADTIMPGASDSELRFFGEVCNRMNLDPFKREIFAVKRKVNEGDRWVDRWVFQTSVDGYRKRAASTGLYAGSEVNTEPEDAPQPKIARATVWRMVAGQRVPFSAVARWSEYVQTTKTGQPMSMWGKMPHVMLAKCAESLALRKAFPDELNGLRTEDEMAHADNPPAIAVAPTVNPFRPAPVAVIEAPAETHAPDEDLRDNLIAKVVDAMQLDDITDGQLNGELAIRYKRPTNWRELPESHLTALIEPSKWAGVVANINTDPLEG